MRSAFTLVEILIVVVILGILAAVVIANLNGASEPARQGSFVYELKYFVDQAEIYRARTGQYLPDGGSGTLPAGFEDYVDAEDWENGTPIGGVWDTEFNDNGVTAALGVHFNGQGQTRDDAYMTQVDAMFDDGDVNTGVFRKLAGDRYYYVMAD